MKSSRKWSQRVTRTSNALDLDPGVFKMGAKDMARSLKRSAERSTRRKSSPFRSAMSMLVFYENRAGKNLPVKQRRTLRAAKQELRELYGKPSETSRSRGRASARRGRSPRRRGRART
jgi:hypothetical protein